MGDGVRAASLGWPDTAASHAGGGVPAEAADLPQLGACRDHQVRPSLPPPPQFLTPLNLGEEGGEAG